MGQGFVIVNKTKMEYLDSNILPAKFRGVINNTIIGKALTRLICVSQNRAYNSYKKLNVYSDKYMGSWSGDHIEIMGDYQEEKELYEIIVTTGKNIFPEVMAMVYDQEEDDLKHLIDLAEKSIIYFLYICEIAMLEDCPRKIIYAIESKFGHNWKEIYYKKRW